MDLSEAKSIAERCVHYGMCKIDFLGTGVCPPGIEHNYVSYYPQGRMEIAHALADGIIPVTERLVDIARSCTFCGICDKQCYFVTGLRPMRVMEALNEYVESYLKENKTIEKVEEDQLLRDLRKVVGYEWAENDPAILIAYTRDLSPMSPRRISKYIVMPESTQEVVDVIKVANKYGVSFVARGTGQFFMQWSREGAVITIDVGRMKKLEVDPENWTATVQAGVTALDLQKEADKYGMLASTGQPAACICANINSTGIDSPFLHSYGVMANHLVDLEIVTPDGKTFRLTDRDAPNFFAFTRPSVNELAPSRGIITQVTVKLYPMTGDEQAIFIPFPSLDDAVTMLREIGRRRIGLGAAILSLNFFTMFSSPTFGTSDELKQFLRNKLGIEHLLMVFGDKYAINTIKEMAEVTVDQAQAKIIMLGIPKLYEDEALELLSRAEGSEEPYKVLLKEELMPLWEMILKPSPENMAQAVDEDMKDFFRELYSRPEMTDLFWLNRFNILSTRMGRNHAVVFVAFYFPLENEAVNEVIETLKAVGDKYNITGDLGVIEPLDYGKRARLEWQYFYDQTNEQERRNAKNAQKEVAAKSEMLARKIRGLRPQVWMANQGFCRMESFLYT
ncbi:FAD-binding protein [Chloroflexota bacterium]